MKTKAILVIFVSSLVLISAQKRDVDNEKLLNLRLRAELRKSLFPRLNKKFVVTDRPFNKERNQIIITRRPFMAKNLQKPKTVLEDKDTELRPDKVLISTKKPYMKVKQFTSISTSTPRAVITTRKYASSFTPKTQVIRFNNFYRPSKVPIINSEELVDSFKISEDENMAIEEVSEEELESFGIEQSEKINKSEERIFSVEDYNFTTEPNFIESEEIASHKETRYETEDFETNRENRSHNIIKDENLGTTISGFKFTGRENLLSNELIYNNINT